MCESLEGRMLLAANDPVISEFMTDNTTGLMDGNNKRGDWIEIQNPGPTAVDMQGWHLTDQANNLTEYTFPSFTIPAGGYKVVFATGETTPFVDSAGYPHTNFKLDSGGEYLALVMPDGVTKTTELNPYPQQSSNISYGFGPGGSVGVTPIPVNANAKVLVPTNNSVDATWTGRTFPDTSWTSGQTGVGYENNPGDAINYTSLIKTNVHDQMFNINGTAYIRLHFNIPDPQSYTSLTLQMKVDDGFVAYLNGQRIASSNAPATLAWNSTASTTGNDSDAIVFKTFDITPHLTDLVAGDNVLAIQGLNSPANSSDFIIMPELDATKLSTTALQYFGTPSPGAANIAGSVVINEIHYNPDLKTDLVEFIELYNSASSPLDISGWKLAGGVDFNFPAGTTIPPNGYTLIAEHPTNFQTKYGKTALGPYTGSLSNSGDSVKLLSPNSAVIDEVHYGAGFPWPTVGDALTVNGTGPSIQLINSGADNDLGGSWRSALPTPGAPNNGVLTANPPPAIRQVSNSPSNPTAGQPVTITAKVTDTNGLASVNLLYQVNAPGAYIPSMIVNTSNFTNSPNPAYLQGWVTLAMFDDGTHGDTTPGDGTYSAQVPPAVNQNRTLIRYKVTATDTLGASVTAPFADDPALNFAYYVYNGVPGWSGAVKPGDPSALGTVVNFTAADMNRIPVYQIIARNQDVTDALHMPPSTASGYTGSVELWRCTLIYNGVVYDNVGFRCRGGSAWRYAMGKNKWEFNFNRNHGFQAYDNYGNPYKEKWDNFDLNAIIDQGNYWQRGEQGMFEGINNKLWNLVGVPANDTAYMELRVVDDAAESTSNQYNGDLWGMYMATDANDGNFLAQHDLPDGNYYRMNPEDGGAGGGTLTDQGATQPSDNSDLVSFTNTYKSGVQTEQWWQDNLNLDEYYSYRTIIEAVHHYDVDQGAGKNYFYYHNPVTNKWEVHPWDSDLTWADNMYGGGDEPFKTRVLPLPDFSIAYKDRIREIRDLLWNTDQAYNLLDEYANQIDPPGVANSPVDFDRDMWDYNPLMNPANPATSYTYGDKGGVGRYYTGVNGAGTSIPAPGGFRGMVQEMKNYIVTRAGVLDTLAADNLIPNKPTLTYLGPSNHAVDKLTFRSSNFVSPSNNSTFASMEWRIGETYDASNPIYSPTTPRPFEITANWESPEIKAFSSDMSIPSGNLEPGHTYRVRVRMKDANGRWSDWSAPIQFVAGAAASSFVTDLRISEIMYNPAPPPVGSPYTSDDFEYVELVNKGSSNLDLSGVKFTQGIDFSFPDGFILNPGQRTLVVKNLAAFQSRYGHAFDASIAGAYPTKTLSNSGDHIRLEGPVGQTILDFSYSDSWYPQTDGQGFSLVIVDPNTDASLYGDKTSWRSSTNPNGDPGQDVAGLSTNAVVVNEILANPTTPNQSWVEIKNNTSAPVDISNWFFSDDSANPEKYQFAANTILAANGYLVLNELSSYGTGAAAFSLSRLGGTTYLSQGDATNTLLGYRDVQDYDPSDAGVSLGIYLKSTGKQDMTAMKTPTPGAANSQPLVGPVVIDEVMYNPQSGGNEFVELHNITDAPVDVSGWTFDGLAYTFASGSVIPAHGYALVVPIDPASFRSTYNVPGVTQVFGPFFGLLDDAGDDIRLKKPGVPAGAITPFIPVDRVNYSADAPWPLAAGVSLIRKDQSAYGNDAINWTLSTGGGSPGKPNSLPVPTGAYDITTALPKIVITFTEDVSSTLTANMLTLQNLSGGGIGTQTMTWDPATLSATWSFDQIPDNGNYRATLHADNLRDFAGNQLDGDGNSTPGGNFTQDFFYLGGDANHDRNVDFADLVVVAQNYGKTGGQLLANGDFNADGNVDFADLVTIAQNYGVTLAPPTPAAPVASEPVIVPVASLTPVVPPVVPAPVNAAKVAAPAVTAVAVIPAKVQPTPVPLAPVKKPDPTTKRPVVTLPPPPKPPAKPATFSKARIR